jgi:excisionase family DNA binding protein
VNENVSEIDPRDYLSPNEVGRRWGTTGESVRRMIKSGKLPALRTPSGRYRIHRDDAVLRSALAS